MSPEKTDRLELHNALPKAMEEKLLTVEDVAVWLRVKPAWVRAHANGNRKPELPSLKLGAYRRFRCQDIQGFLEELGKRRR